VQATDGTVSDVEHGESGCGRQGGEGEPGEVIVVGPQLEVVLLEDFVVLDALDDHDRGDEAGDGGEDEFRGTAASAGVVIVLVGSLS